VQGFADGLPVVRKPAQSQFGFHGLVEVVEQDDLRALVWNSLGLEQKIRQKDGVLAELMAERVA
jgi:hypothetical protein